MSEQQVFEHEVVQARTAPTSGTRTYDPALMERVRAFYADWAACLDEDRYRDWLGLFHQNAEYSVTDRDNADTGLYLTKERGIVALQVRAAYLSGYWRMQRKPRVHLIGNPRVFVESDGTLHVKASVVLVRTGLDGHSRVHAAGTYDDLLAAKGEGFEILRHAVVLDADVQPYDMTDIV
ncbi:aromatic-ring-hydroxylating dioxygenase subunit beta [Embleya sp. NPDC055664]|uniref:aromatic-ring-hydroxylating dioxygenase subunit beta n=1 Tax=Embleya sp. NPDC059237 TaxID=3346784 RepID=UPI00368FF434